MIIDLGDGRSVDTQKDLSAAERHILQKLFIWEAMARSVEEFRESRVRAFRLGWNNSGPVAESAVMTAILKDLEQKVVARLRVQ
ncbi:MAG TPA: hypothetical protein PLM79_18010 [Syntrophobacteraceae bacterium]|nr:hypothetical protein [Syntrophobacteraceae bacterium]